jgi:hypothetical protein
MPSPHLPLYLRAREAPNGGHLFFKKISPPFDVNEGPKRANCGLEHLFSSFFSAPEREKTRSEIQSALGGANDLGLSTAPEVIRRAYLTGGEITWPTYRNHLDCLHFYF